VKILTWLLFVSLLFSGMQPHLAFGIYREQIDGPGFQKQETPAPNQEIQTTPNAARDESADVQKSIGFKEAQRLAEIIFELKEQRIIWEAAQEQSLPSNPYRDGSIAKSKQMTREELVSLIETATQIVDKQSSVAVTADLASNHALNRVYASLSSLITFMATVVLSSKYLPDIFSNSAIDTAAHIFASTYIGLVAQRIAERTLNSFSDMLAKRTATQRSHPDFWLALSQYFPKMPKSPQKRIKWLMRELYPTLTTASKESPHIRIALQESTYESRLRIAICESYLKDPLQHSNQDAAISEAAALEAEALVKSSR